jgi:hypothetical protein
MKLKIDGHEVVELLHEMDMTDGMKKDIRKTIRRELNAVKKKVQQAARSSMRSDRRGASRAVKVRMYKKVLGGNVSIEYRTKVKTMGVEASHSTGGKSGIKRVRKISKRTRELNAYRGENRNFILKFLNAGTANRITNGGTMRPASRGSLSGSGFFAAAADPGIEQASGNLVAAIEKMLVEKGNS